MNSAAHDFENNSLNSDILSLSLKKENVSSYGGIYSNWNEDESVTDPSNNDKSKKKLQKSQTQNVTFQWDEEGSDSQVVYLTGSFCNWKQFFIMPKLDNKYILTIALPKALHKFKFRINEDFKLNKNYPVMKEGNNNFNYIDTSETKETNKSENSEKDISESDDTDESDSISSSSSYEPELDDKEERFRRKKSKLKKKKYSQIFPKKTKLNNYAPDVPYSYNYMYNIDVISSQNFIGKRKYYEPKEYNILGDNCSYKKIGVLPAVEINHLHSNTLIVSGDRALCSSFTRYRNKFITFLYYKPFND